MRSILLAASLALVPLTPAFADVPASWPPLVREALGAAHDGGEDDVWRFTMTADYGETGAFTARFDSSRPENARWTLIEPASPDSMSEALREEWIDLSTPDEEDADEAADADGEENGGSFSIGGEGSGLFFGSDAIGMIAGDFGEPRQTRGRTVYTFAPSLADDEADEGEADAFSRFLAGELTVAQADPFVERIRIHAPASFKPHPAARVHEFEMVMEFARVGGLPAPVLSGFSTRIDLSALFQRQTQTVRFTFNDVEYEAR